MNLKGTVAVVTGGADGIGLGAARAFKHAGARVVLADVDGEKVRSAAESGGYEGLECDVTSDESVERLRAFACALGDVAVVMANAGIAVGGRFEAIPVSEWQRLFEVNVFGVVRTINAFLPGMLERRQGRIVITGSSAGLFGGNGTNAPYASSKHALHGLARSLAVYCREQGVAVHYLAPRLTNTAFPLSSVAWGRQGSRVTSDRDIGDDYDTVDDVIDALLRGIERDQFLVSLTGDTTERLVAYARDPSAAV